MACFAFNGLPPNPPRVWSRVQGFCPDDSAESDSYITKQEQAELIAMLSKGNVLQYKKNSSNITKNQRYSQIAKGKWTNRNTSWASQSVTTTIPNTQSLKRVNYKTIYLDGGASANGIPITCPEPIIPTIPRTLPTNPNRSSTSMQLTDSQLGITDAYTNRCPIYVTPTGPPIPGTYGPFPILPNKPVDPIIIPVLPVINPPPTPIPPVVIPDGGTLICTISEDICTGQILSTSEERSNCNPTSASDVPGPIVQLCYNDSLPTYYPRRRYVMTNSGNKFPVNYKFMFAN